MNLSYTCLTIEISTMVNYMPHGHWYASAIIRIKTKTFKALGPNDLCYDQYVEMISQNNKEERCWVVLLVRG